jgi:metallo-beta-lactamase superfamily protein
MLTQVADGVWVRQSEWVWTNSIVVRAEDGLVLVDPGIQGSELDQLADDLDRLGIPVVAGFSTHPHWDHLLWHARFGDVPRYATAAAAQVAGEARERAQAMAAESAPGIPLELVALVTPLPADGGPVPGDHRRRSRLHRRAAARRGTGRRASRGGLAVRPPPVEPGAGPRGTFPLNSGGPLCPFARPREPAWEDARSGSARTRACERS